MFAHKLSGEVIKRVKWNSRSVEYSKGSSIVKVCPDTYVMKAVYECFTYNAQQVQKATGKTIEQLYKPTQTILTSKCTQVNN